MSNKLRSKQTNNPGETLTHQQISPTGESIYSENEFLQVTKDQWTNGKRGKGAEQYYIALALLQRCSFLPIIRNKNRQLLLILE
jgi:hypothetical protein